MGEKSRPVRRGVGERGVGERLWWGEMGGVSGGRGGREGGRTQGF